jgi:hypothetical protein
VLPGAACKWTAYAVEKSKGKAQQNTERRNDMLTQSYCPPSFVRGDRGEMLLGGVASSPEVLERIVSCPSG